MTRPAALIIALGLIAIQGCNRSQHEFEQARAAENTDPARALTLYDKVLASSPARHDPAYSSAIHQRRAEILLQLQHPADALNDVAEAVKLAPDNLRYQLELAELLLLNSLPQAAGDQARVALRMSPRDPRALSVLAISLALTGRDDEALPILQDVHQRNPERHEVATMLARLLIARGDARGAKEALTETLRADPQHAGAALLLARILEEEGDALEAELFYRQSDRVEHSLETGLRLAQFLQRAARFDESFEILRRLGQADASSPLMGDAELVSGRARDALVAYAGAERRSLTALAANQASQPGVAVALKARVVEADLELALTSAPDLEAHARALRLARLHLTDMAEAMDPATRWMLEAELALASNQLKSARESAERAASLAPQSAAAHYLLGVVCQRLEDFACTNREFTVALDQDPAYIPAHLAIAEAELAKGHYAGAENHVAGAIRSEPGNLRGLMLYTRVLMAQQRWPEAVRMAQRAAAANRSNPAADVLLGRALLGVGNGAAAMLRFQRVLLQDPRDPGAIEGLVAVYQTAHVTPPMLLQLERAAISPPQSPVLMEIAGRLYAVIGDHMNARRCLTQTLRLDPGRWTAADALEKISRDETNPARTESDAVALNNRAWELASSGRDLTGALAMARQAAASAPNDARVLDTIGFILLRGRQFSAAIPALQKAVAAAERAHDDDTSKAARAHLADAYAGAGDTRASSHTFDEPHAVAE